MIEFVKITDKVMEINFGLENEGSVEYRYIR